MGRRVSMLKNEFTTKFSLMLGNFPLKMFLDMYEESMFDNEINEKKNLNESKKINKEK